MLSAGLRILDLDGGTEPPPGQAWPEETVVRPLRQLGPELRLWADARGREAFRAALEPAHRHLPTLLGSGDFHHLSALLVEQFSGEPFSLLVFDHHPDWDRLPPAYGCGAWINRALEVPGLRHLALIGNASADLAYPSALTGNRNAVRSGQLSLHPWRMPRGRFPFPAFPKVAFHELEADPDRGFESMLRKIPTQNIYVSIDKDCLQPTHALSNWEPGCLPLSFLLRCLSRLRREKTILGLDITGDFSPPAPQGRWKRFCSRIDHPKHYSAQGHALAEIRKTNFDTTCRILETLEGKDRP